MFHFSTPRKGCFTTQLNYSLVINVKTFPQGKLPASELLVMIMVDSCRLNIYTKAMDLPGASWNTMKISWCIFAEHVSVLVSSFYGFGILRVAVYPVLSNSLTAGIWLIFQGSIIQRICIFQHPSKVCSCIESNNCVGTICTNAIQHNEGCNLNLYLQYFASHFRNVLHCAVKYLCNSWIIVYYKISLDISVYILLFLFL